MKKTYYTNRDRLIAQLQSRLAHRRRHIAKLEAAIDETKRLIIRIGNLANDYRYFSMWEPLELQRTDCRRELWNLRQEVKINAYDQKLDTDMLKVLRGHIYLY